MKVDAFDFDLNRDLIAIKPTDPRDSSKLLDLSEKNKIIDRHFYDLPNLLQKGDILVFNDTKVIPAKLFALKGNAKLEVTLYRPENSLLWWSFIKNSKRLKVEDTIIFSHNFSAKVVQKKGENGILLEFLCKPEDFYRLLDEYGYMPLPPYIKRKPGNDDKENYQTVYAKNQGAVAAPTAGLHFTDNTLKELEKKGIKKAFITLHVGAGTFLPVKVNDTKDHKMHSEFGIISKQSTDFINETKKSGGRIIAVGTTALRLLESAADKNGTLHPFCDDTDIFITPGYKFKIVDLLITNFHLPKSTLFMLVCAFAGTNRMKKAYEHAKNNAYRFYSYGDSSLLKREQTPC